MAKTRQEIVRRYAERHPNQAKEYYQKNKNRIAVVGAAYYAVNKQRISERRKKRRRENPELFQARRRADYLKIGRQRLNEIKRRRLETDANYRIRENMASRVRMAIKRSGGFKSRKTSELVGCSVEFLRGYIEARFQPGMSWANIGEWEIDHRIPCAEFDLRVESQQRQCFHYTNLQPLWATANRSKGAKVPQSFQAELI